MTIAYEYAARVILRYGVGSLAFASGGKLASDPDLVALVALALSAAVAMGVEWWTKDARRKGRKT